MRFLVLVFGILLACVGGAWFTLQHDVVALCVAFAGLAIVIGEGCKIGMMKEVEEDKLVAQEEKMEKDLGIDI